MAAGVALAALLAIGMWLFRGPAAPAELAGAAPREDAPAPEQRSEAAAIDAGSPAVLEPSASAPSVERREPATELRAAIERARDARLRELAAAAIENHPAAGSAAGPGAGAAPAPEDEAPQVGTLDREYIRGAVRELHPLIAECYDLAREAAEREGADVPEGRLVVRFVIGGEPGVGGVIEESAVMDESELRHPLLEECLTETIYTVELPAPEEGGRVTVHYPFVLSSRDEAEAEAEAR